MRSYCNLVKDYHEKLVAVAEDEWHLQQNGRFLDRISLGIVEQNQIINKANLELAKLRINELEQKLTSK